MSADPKATILETEDFHRRVFREQCQRDAKLAQVVRPRVYEDEGPDAAETFWADMCPSDATFR